MILVNIKIDLDHNCKSKTLYLVLKNPIIIVGMDLYYKLTVIE